jgi:hypothetical protein
MSNGIDIDDLDMDTFINSLQFITTVTIDDIEPKSKNSIHPVFLTLSSSFFRCMFLMMLQYYVTLHVAEVIESNAACSTVKIILRQLLLPQLYE